jgi:ABC-type lipoprotein release transport system permease subunit
MRDLDVSIGGDVVLPPGDRELARTFEVVGEVIVNDGFESRPGNGALVTPTAFMEIAPDGDGSTYAVWVDDDVDRRATLAAVHEAFPTTYVEPRPADKIANLRHVADQPKLLTLVVGLLAGAALIHALVMSVARSRRQIGVLKTLGFTRRQVVASVGWHATSIAVAALMIGVPLGIVGGRLAWTSISGSLGLEPHHALPVSAILVAAVVVLVVANTAAVLPGIAAARTRTSSALRAE